MNNYFLVITKMTEQIFTLASFNDSVCIILCKIKCTLSLLLNNALFSEICFSLPKIKVSYENNALMVSDSISFNKIKTKLKIYIVSGSQYIGIKKNSEFSNFQFYDSNNDKIKLLDVLNPGKIKYNISQNYNFNFIVVFGSSDLIIRAKRVNRALKLFNTFDYKIDNKEIGLTQELTFIVFSGGKGNNKQQSEAQSMKDYAIMRGLKENCIICESKSINTMQNIEFATQLIEKVFPEIHYPHTYHFVSSENHIFLIKKISNTFLLNNLDIKYYF